MVQNERTDALISSIKLQEPQIQNETVAQSSKDNEKSIIKFCKRPPEAIIIGVKKCGTMTLG